MRSPRIVRTQQVNAFLGYAKPKLEDIDDRLEKEEADTRARAKETDARMERTRDGRDGLAIRRLAKRLTSHRVQHSPRLRVTADCTVSGPETCAAPSSSRGLEVVQGLRDASTGDLI